MLGLQTKATMGYHDELTCNFSLFCCHPVKHMIIYTLYMRKQVTQPAGRFYKSILSGLDKKPGCLIYTAQIISGVQQSPIYQDPI